MSLLRSLSVAFVHAELTSPRLAADLQKSQRRRSAPSRSASGWLTHLTHYNLGCLPFPQHPPPDTSLVGFTCSGQRYHRNLGSTCRLVYYCAISRPPAPHIRSGAARSLVLCKGGPDLATQGKQAPKLAPIPYASSIFMYALTPCSTYTVVLYYVWGVAQDL